MHYLMCFIQSCPLFEWRSFSVGRTKSTNKFITNGRLNSNYWRNGDSWTSLPTLWSEYFGFFHLGNFLIGEFISYFLPLLTMIATFTCYVRDLAYFITTPVAYILCRLWYRRILWAPRSFSVAWWSSKDSEIACAIASTYWLRWLMVYYL